jgi:hypothetical protein
MNLLDGRLTKRNLYLLVSVMRAAMGIRCRYRPPGFDCRTPTS